MGGHYCDICREGERKGERGKNFKEGEKDRVPEMGGRKRDKEEVGKKEKGVGVLFYDGVV